MYCNTEGCACNGYFPSKSYESVVQENIALRKEIAELKASLEPFTQQQNAMAAGTSS
jgi:cell division septum initiation protein DivIVA